MRDGRDRRGGGAVTGHHRGRAGQEISVWPNRIEGKIAEKCQPSPRSNGASLKVVVPAKSYTVWAPSAASAATERLLAVATRAMLSSAGGSFGPRHL